MNIVFVTSFPSNMFDVYARQMLESFARNMPKETPLIVHLDDDLVYPQVDKILPKEYGVNVGWSDEHKAFVERNKGKDHPTDYRKQAVRFCHKVFAIYDTMKAAIESKAVDKPRYLVWIDADVLITRPVTVDEIKACLPKEGHEIAYLGRKDWDHSECGWLAFDLQEGGCAIIKQVYNSYVEDLIFSQDQWHDSWIWDWKMGATQHKTNLTADKPGSEIWPQSPMAAWSVHYKGPIAKQNLVQPQVRLQNGQNFVIKTKNAIPAENIRAHIEENQRLIKNWIKECEPNDERIIIASAGPLLIAEDLRNETDKIVAVKHALVPLKKAGIKPWACILLDPRPHVADFVDVADKDIIWFVASQVNPKVTQALLDQGCEVWGYHASVGADEKQLTIKQPLSIISGGSATATRGIYTLAHLGFRKFKLYGYDLSFPDKPDLNARDDIGQPKFMEFSINVKDAHVDVKKHFFSEPQLIAQYEEMAALVQNEKFEIEAVGDGLIPFMLKYRNLGRLRENELKCKMGGKLSSYRQLWNNHKKTRSSRIWGKILSKTPHKQTVKSK